MKLATSISSCNQSYCALCRNVNLNDSAAAIIELVDGQRTVAEIAALLATRYGMDVAAIASDIEDLLQRLAIKTWLVLPAAQTH